MRCAVECGCKLYFYTMQVSIVIGLFVVIFLVDYMFTNVQDKTLTMFLVPAIIKTIVVVVFVHIMTGKMQSPISTPAIAEVVNKFKVAGF
jgi:flagellar biosynthesis protein FliQ